MAPLSPGQPWPALPLAPWRSTRDTLHMWTQMLGKTLLASPAQNHWWHTALRVSAHGLVTPPVVLDGRSFEVELDFVDHLLAVRSDHRSVTTPLVPRTVRSFYEEYLELVRAIGVDLHIRTTPVEVPDPIPFEQDETHRSYDAEAAYRFFQVLRRCDAAFKALTSSFIGKQSPVHFWWGAFDLASTRFSGRRAPARPGVDHMQGEAYSHEVISFGFWPGGALPQGITVSEANFYAYAAPQPEGFDRAAVEPAAARYDAGLGEFLLPYEAVRTAEDPVATIHAFCQSVYVAGATLGGWDRQALERAPVPRAEPYPSPSYPAEEHPT